MEGRSAAELYADAEELTRRVRGAKKRAQRLGRSYRAFHAALQSMEQALAALRAERDDEQMKQHERDGK